jgi:hypothetical protein
MGGVEVHFHALLTSALDASEPSASRPGGFTSEERVATTTEDKTGLNPDVGLAVVYKKRLCALAWNRTPVL